MSVIFWVVDLLASRELWIMEFPSNRLVRHCSNSCLKVSFNILKPTGYVMHQQFNIQQLYALPTLYWCVFYLFKNKQQIVPLTA
jgi:hypothetical protein